MSGVIYEVRDLVKYFGRNRAVAGVSFEARVGQCLGLLGPNGAGKSTTIEIMEGISQPSSGSVLYRGMPLDEDFRQSVGVMFQSTALPEFIKVREVMEMFSRLYRKRGDIESLIERCGVGEFLGQATQKISGGQRQRLLLAIALINDPDVIFLDEPTTGLDPSARQSLWRIIREAKAEGKTIVLTTHYMEEAYALCDAIILMNRGEIVAQGSPRQLLAEEFSTSVLELPKSIAEASPGLVERVEANDRLSLEVGEKEWRFECKDVNEGIGFLIDNKLDLSELHIRKKTLEDLFFKLTSH